MKNVKNFRNLILKKLGMNFLNIFIQITNRSGRYGRNCENFIKILAVPANFVLPENVFLANDYLRPWSSWTLIVIRNTWS